MTKTLDIILDCDSVLGHTMQLLLTYYNREYGLKWRYENFSQWKLTEIQEPGTDIMKYFAQPDFIEQIPVYPHARRIVSMLAEQGDTLYVATAVPLEVSKQRVEWVLNYFGNWIPKKRIVVIESKAELLRGDVILDDGLHNLIGSHVHYPVVFDQPWNRKPEGEPFLRIGDWDQFYGLVQKIRTGRTYADLLAEQRFQNEKAV